MSDRISEGDLVHLKSGGPTMTVHSTYKPQMQGNPTHAECSWFVDKIAHRKNFNVNELIVGKSPDNEPPTYA